MPTSTHAGSEEDSHSTTAPPRMQGPLGLQRASQSPPRNASLRTQTPHAGPPPSPPNDGIISFDNTKAGLQHVDKEKTEALIKELSEGSAFYTNEQRKAAARERKVKEMLAKKQVFEQTIMQQPHRAVAGAGGGRSSVNYAELAAAVERRERELITYGDEYGLKRGKVFVHLDMDMFYAACEEKKNPSLTLKPLGVGSNAMLSTTNYVARQYGVRSGMPGFIGKKLCPSLVIIPCDFSFYKKEAEAVRDIVRQYDPDFSSAGWDELTMELSDYLAQHEDEKKEEHDNDKSHCEGGRNAGSREATFDRGERTTPAVDEGQVASAPDAHTQRMQRRYAAAERVVRELRARIHEATQLTASAGIAPSSTLAKIASNFNKPNGQHTLFLYSRKDVMDFMHGLACRQVPGIGKSQEQILNGLGIKTVGDIYRNRVLLSYLITPKTFHFLLSTSLGVGGMFHDEREDGGPDAGAHREGSRDPEEHEGGEKKEPHAMGGFDTRKSIGQERTFYKLKSAFELETIARRNLQEATQRVVAKGLLARQMVLKMKHVSFQVKQYSQRIDPPSDDAEVLQHTLNALITPIAHGFSDYRLLGVRLEKLIPKAQYEQQASLRHGGSGQSRPPAQQQHTLMDLMGPGQAKHGSGGDASLPRRAKRARSSSPRGAPCFSISDDETSLSSGDESIRIAEEEQSQGVVVEVKDGSTDADRLAPDDAQALVSSRQASTVSVELLLPSTKPEPTVATDRGQGPKRLRTRSKSAKRHAGRDDDDVVVIE